MPLGGDIVLPWEVSYVTGTLPTTPSEASQWVGLYAAGSCPVDHGCHLGAVHVPIQDIAGLARFRISDYGQAGQFEVCSKPCAPKPWGTRATLNAFES